MTWEVAVQGDRADLSLLAQVLASSDLRLQQEGEKFVLTSYRFESAQSENEIHRIASSILDVLSGVARVLLDSPGGFSVSSISKLLPDGKIQSYATITGTARVRDQILVVARNKEGEVIATRTPADPAAGWMRVAMQSDSVAAALERLRDPESWGGLYNVSEIVREDVGGEHEVVSRGWATRGELERFRRTACSPDVIGPLARHGVQPADPPPKPMAFADAVSLVRRLVCRWIDEKAESL